MDRKKTKLNQMTIWAGVLLHVFALISLAISWNKSFWRDEAFSAITSARPVGDIVAISARDVSPPLYYLALHFWQRLFGSGDMVLRVTSLIFALITLVSVYELIILGHRSLVKVKEKISLPPVNILLLIPTFNLVLLYFSAELRNYALLMLTILWSLVASYKAIFSENRRWLLLLMVVNLVQLYVHSLSIIWMVAQNMTVLLWAVMYRRWKPLMYYLLSQAVVVVTFSPWLMILIKQTKNVSESFWISFDYWESRHEYDGLFLINEGEILYPRLEQWFIRLTKNVSIFGILAFGLTTIDGWLKTKKFKVSPLKDLSVPVGMLVTSTVASLVGFYVFSIVVSPVLYFRYLSMFAGLIMLVVVVSSVYVYQLNTKLFYLFVAGYITLSVVIGSGFILKSHKTNYRMMADRPGETILTDEPLDISPCVHYDVGCLFVGDITKTPRFIGSSQLDHLASIADWGSVKVNRPTVLFRDRLKPEIMSLLSASSYIKGETIDLGGSVYLQRFYKY